MNSHLNYQSTKYILGPLRALLVIFPLIAAALPPAMAREPNRMNRLHAARTWMYQLQGLENKTAVARLAATEYPLLVIEPGHNFKEFPHDTRAMLRALRYTPTGKKRLILAYVDIGQAEDYRDYWRPDWVPPTRTAPGKPDFMITIDPDGWSGNYPVAFWRAAWKNLWMKPSGIVPTLAHMGFDGLYLDWVEAYDDEFVMAAAETEGVEPAGAMIELIEELGRAGRKVIPDFLIIPQNAPYLIDRDPDRYARAISALAVEDTWFHGRGDAEWDDPEAGDLHDRHQDDFATPRRLAQYRKYQRRGLPVFSVDYCVSGKNAALVYQKARQAKLRPLVTRVSLSRLTETPPPPPESK